MNKLFYKVSARIVFVVIMIWYSPVFAACNNNVNNPNNACFDECKADETYGASGFCDSIADDVDDEVPDSGSLNNLDTREVSLCENQYFVDNNGFCAVLADFCEINSNNALCDDLCANTYFLEGQAGNYSFCTDFCSSDPKPSYCPSTGTSGTSNGDLSLSSQPLFLGEYADPNLIITLSDSNAMMEEVLPLNGANFVYPPVSGVYGPAITTASVREFDAESIDSVKARSSSFNTLYYDPNKTYIPWTDEEGNPIINQQSNATADMNFGVDGGILAETVGGDYCAPYNPTDLAKGCLKLNKVQNSAATWIGNAPYDFYYPAVYYVYKGNESVLPANCTSGDESDVDCYVEYVIAPDATDFSDVSNPDNVYTENNPDPQTLISKSVLRDAVVNLTSKPFPSERSYDEEMQNFANWFTYYRSKLLTLRAAAGAAFKEIPDNYRVALALTNRTSSTDAIDDSDDSKDFSSEVMLSGVESFSTSDADIFDNLYSVYNAGAARSLLKAFDEVGGYFASTYSGAGPWSDNPPVEDGPSTVAAAEYCRRSYNLTIADGYFEDGGPDAPSTGDTLSEIANRFFDPGLEGNTGIQSGIGADIAGVANPELGTIDVNFDGSFDDHGDNVAIFTHLTQLTIGFGIDAGDLPDVGDPIATSPSLPVTSYADTVAGRLEKLKDLYYAAVSSGGRYYQANTYDQLYTAIVNQIEAVALNQGYLDSTSSGAAVALNSGSLFNGSILFQALFNASEWSGTVKAFLINPLTGALNSTAVTHSFPSAASRVLATFGCTSTGCDGVDFTQSGLEGAYLTTDVQTDVNSLMYQLETAATGNDRADAVAWFKGTDGSLRSRTNLLGDIIHAAPVYVGEPNGPYYSWSSSDDEASSSYQEFIDAQCIVGGGDDCYRKEVVLVGANDGFLHFFNVDIDGSGDSLSEIAAYMPKALFDEAGRLSLLKTDAYEHDYFVDSTPTVGDAYIDTGAGSKSWHTVVVGGLGAGGKGIYAIDITAKTNDNGVYAFDGAAALKSKILWEYTATTPIDDSGDYSSAADDYLGYTYSRPNIVRLPNGDWGVIFGNGYNSASADGQACLYTLDLATGALLSRVCVDGISSAPEDGGNALLMVDSNGNALKNGMSTVTPVDIDGDFVVDYVYAGDLYGNLWKFEYSGNTNNGDLDVLVANSQGNNYEPLFRAGIFDITANGADKPYIQVQSITSRPQVIRHPSSYGGYLVMFGTGKYLESSDSSFGNPTNEIQTFYAIWDRDEGAVSEFNRTHLLPQDILFDISIQNQNNESFDYRITTNRGYPNMPWHFDAGSVPDNGVTASKTAADPNNNDYTYDHLEFDYPCLDGDATSSMDCEYLGWFMDLYKTYDNNLNSFTNIYTLGERQVTDAVVRNGRVIFTTTVPDNSVCGSGDYGWLMELDAESGSRLPFTPFDINGDGNFTSADYAAYTEAAQQILDGGTGIPVSGRKSTVGLLPTPGILSDYSDAASGKEFKYMSGSSGDIEAISENPGASSDESFRQSWRELRLDDMINFNNL